MERLAGAYKGQTVSIVGKGPSLRYLSAKDFIPGPIIAMNEAIITVEKLGLDNPIYSLQKDIGPYATVQNEGQGYHSPVCERAPNCGDRCGYRIRPEKATLFLDMNESGCCLPDYSPRIEFNINSLGLSVNLSSFFVALKIGRLMECARYRLVCCDAISATQDNRIYIPGQSFDCNAHHELYENQRKIAHKYFLPQIDYDTVTPQKDGGQEIIVPEGPRDKVSIIIPVIRPDSAERCINAIIENAGVPQEQFEIVHAHDLEGIGCPRMVEKLTDKTCHDLVMFLGDDTVPQPGFLKMALGALEALPDRWGVVGLNTEPGNDHAHWMADKRMLKHIPGEAFFSTEYKHCYGDDELKDIAMELGRWVFAETSHIDHIHPINQSADYDEGYQVAYSDANLKHDRWTYQRRKVARLRKANGISLGIGWPVTNMLMYSGFVLSYIALEKRDHSFFVPYSANQFDMSPKLINFDEARNSIVDQSLMAGCSHLLMMDTDQIYYTKNMIERLLGHKKKVVAARVHRRYPPFDPLMFRYSEKSTGDLEIPGTLELIDHDEFKAAHRTGARVEVDNTGAGCVLYDTSVFFDVKPPWYEHKRRKDGQPIGEDMVFHNKLRQAGIKIYVDTGIEIIHLSVEGVGADKYFHFNQLIKAQEAKQNERRKQTDL